MIGYENKVLFEDNLSDRTIVVDINCQGVLELEQHQRRFCKEFPQTLKLLQVAFLTGTLKPGQVITNMEDGFKLALIVTRYSRVGSLKDSPEAVNLATMKAIESLEHKKIVSPVLNKDIISSWPIMHNIIKGKDVDWVVYTK